MTHKDIFKMFKTLFPMYSDRVTEYFPTGKNTIRVRIGELHQDFIFSFYGSKDWRFETVDSFTKTLRKGEK